MRTTPRADTLCGIPEQASSPWEVHTFVTMAVDGNGALYVPDSHTAAFDDNDNLYVGDINRGRALEFQFNFLPRGWKNLWFQFRRLTDTQREWLRLSDADIVRAGETTLTVDMGRIGGRLWGHRDKLAMTARLVALGGAPVTNWSPEFALAQDEETCGVPWPTPADEPGSGGCGLGAARDYSGVELDMLMLLLAPLALAVRSRRRDRSRPRSGGEKWE